MLGRCGTNLNRCIRISLYTMYIHTHIYKYVYMHIYICIFTCICTPVCCKHARKESPFVFQYKEIHFAGHTLCFCIHPFFCIYNLFYISYIFTLHTSPFLHFIHPFLCTFYTSIFLYFIHPFCYIYNRNTLCRKYSSGNTTVKKISKDFLKKIAS